MELHGVEPFFFVFHSRYRAVLRVGGGPEAVWHLGDIVRMAHPGDGLFRHILNALKQQAGFVVAGFGLAVFRGDAGGNLSAQGVRHQLTAVADAQNGNAQLKNLRADPGRSVIVYAVGTAGEDDAHRVQRPQLLNGCLIAFDFAVYAAFTDSAGNQLVVLTAEIENQYFFHIIPRGIESPSPGLLHQ